VVASPKGTAAATLVAGARSRLSSRSYSNSGSRPVGYLVAVVECDIAEAASRAPTG